MKLFGWALIITGGGLVVLGARKLLGTAEEVDYKYEPEDEPELDQWEQHLLDVEAQGRNAHTSVHDLNDGA